MLAEFVHHSLVEAKLQGKLVPLYGFLMIVGSPCNIPHSLVHPCTGRMGPQQPLRDLLRPAVVALLTHQLDFRQLFLKRLSRLRAVYQLPHPCFTVLALLPNLRPLILFFHSVACNLVAISEI